MRALMVVTAACVLVLFSGRTEKPVASKGDLDTRSTQIVMKTPRTSKFAELKTDATGVMRAEVRINGVAITMIIDTGASYVALSESTAKSIAGLEFIGTTSVLPAWGPAITVPKVKIR